MNLLRKKQQLSVRRSSQASIRQTRATDSELEQRYTFRRNRTLTGSLASNVASASETHSQLRSHRVHAHDLRRHRRKLSSVLLGVMTVVVLLGFLVYQSIASVQIKASTAISVDQQLYQQKIQAYLNGRPLERFRFSLDTKRLTQYLQLHDCPEIAAVSADMRFVGFGTTELQLTIREPAVAWKTGDNNLYVDDTGVSFVRNYYSEPNVKVVDQTGIVTKDNKVLASNRFLGFIGRVIGQMKLHGYHVNQVDLPLGTSRQIAVHVDGISYPIKLSVDRPVGEQVEDTTRAVQYLAAKGIKPTEYLDVRVSQRAFYR